MEGGVKCSCSGFSAVIVDERKVAGKRNYILQPWWSSLCEPRWQRCRFGRLLVSRIVAGNDRPRTLTGILTSWSRESGRRSGGQFTSTWWRGIN
jgi:hypothetical protein